MKNGKSRNQIKPNKTKPEALAILAGRLMGKSNRQIGREMKKAHGTVAKVLNSAEVQAEIEKAKSRIFGLVDRAIDVIETALDTNDAAVALHVLKGLGILEQKLKVDSSGGSLGTELEKVIILRSGSEDYVRELSAIPDESPAPLPAIAAPASPEPPLPAEEGRGEIAVSIPLRVLGN